MNGAIDWAMLTATVCVPVTLAALGGLWILANRLTKAENMAAVAREAAASVTAGLGAAHQRIDKLTSEVAEFKEKVAREYVPNAALDKLESKMAEEFRYVREALVRMTDEMHNSSRHGGA